MQFGFKLEGDTLFFGTDFNSESGRGYLGHGQIDSDLQNDLSTSNLELEREGYIFSYHPPVYIPPSGSENLFNLNWNTSTNTYRRPHDEPEALYLPVPVSSPADFPIPPSSYDVSTRTVTPPKVIGEKRPRLAEFGEENVLPEDEVRKRIKTSRYLEQ